MSGATLSEPLRVFVGTSASGEDAEACLVCEATLRRHTTAALEITWLRLSRAPGDLGHGWNTERWTTPWTGLRWAVPALCGWAGRAVYLDCPQIVVGDVAALAGTEMSPRAMVLLRREGPSLLTGCLVWDCAAARGHVPDLGALRADLGAHQMMGSLLVDRPHLAGDLPAGWGAQDAAYARAPAEVVGSVHCANLRMQPHARLALPRLRRARREHWYREVRMRHFCPGLEALFDREYAAALRAGYSVERYVPAGEATVPTRSPGLN